MTSGLTCEYFVAVWKLSATRPSAMSETRTRAILRYVFITRAEPYSSTNWRLALSSVFGFRSATVAFITLLNCRIWRSATATRCTTCRSPGPRESRSRSRRSRCSRTPESRLREALGIRLERWRIAVAFAPPFRYRRRRIRGTDEIMVWPPWPEKIEFVSDGTSTIPTQKVAITATACRAYTPYSADVIVGGSVVTYRNTNCSKIIRNAIATTGMNEY